MAQANAHLKAGEPVKAVAVLEEHVSRIDGNRAYLRLLEDAYRASIRDLLEKNDVGTAAKYRTRLSILDRTAANDPALQPAPGRAAAQSIPGRYQEIPPSKFAKLVEVLGAPEQDPVFGHVSAFSPNGTRALYATGGFQPGAEAIEDAIVGLWDVDKGVLLSEWRIPKVGVTALTFTPDGTKFLLGLQAPGAKGKEAIALSLRDIKGEELKVFKGHTTPILSLAVSADGRQALAGGSAGDVRLWDLETGKDVINLKGHGNKAGQVFAVAFAADGTGLSSAQDSKIYLWDLKSGKILRTLEHSPGAIGLSVSKDGHRAASLTFDLSVKVWDLATGKELQHLKKDHPTNGIGTLALSPDGKRVLAVVTGPDPTGANEETTTTLYDAAVGKKLWSVKTAFKGLVPIHFEKGLLGGGANPFTQWDLDKGIQVKAWGGHKGAISGVVVRPKAERIYSVGLDGQLVRWVAGKPYTIGGHVGGINGLAVSASGKYILTAGADKNAKYWEAGLEEKLLHTLTGHTAQVTGVAILEDGKYAVSASADRTLKIWDLKTGKETDTLTGHGDAVNAVAVSPDGKWIASASDDNSVRLWPVKDGKLLDRDKIMTLDGHKRQVLSVAFSPDGKHVLSGSQDATLKLWETAEGACVKTMEGHKNWVHALGFKDNKHAVSASDDLTIRFWDLDSGKEVDQIDMGKSTDVPRCVTFDPATRSLLVGTASWTILRFEANK